MGIRKQARDAFAANLAAFKATNPTREQMRRWVAATVDAANEWLVKRDAQDASAPASFATTRQAQYQSFLDALPDVVLDPVPD